VHDFASITIESFMSATAATGATGVKGTNLTLPPEVVFIGSSTGGDTILCLARIFPNKT
jgi:hypothetical protein